MISISKINSLTLAFIFAIVFIPTIALAQGTLTLSISPTLFEMSANPGQNWSSSVKVINSNPFEIKVFADVVNFAPQGESGQGKFLPVFESETDGQTLAEWISLEKREIIIPAEQSMLVPFNILVPDDAPPGGHFAAVMIGTRSLRDESTQTKVETSQVVSSLVFLRVSGDIVEKGSIREFRSTKMISESPEVSFELRFENKGNVHIQPQGDIKILNMWGQERGVIPVNRKTMFGNVLPDSIRKYNFTWSGQWSLADMGRYTAVASLAYGEESRQFANSETSFWVIPWKILGVVILFFAGFVALVTWAIKLYVRRMLSIAGVSPELHSIKQHVQPVKRARISVVSPIELGILDLRSQLSQTESWKAWLLTLRKFIIFNKIFFIAISAIVVFIVIVSMYIRSASVENRSYEITINGVGSEVTISSEQMAYEELVKNSPNINQNNQVKEFPLISIVNQSGVSGLGAQLQLELENEGYVITDLDNDLSMQENNTVIVYDPEFAEEALQLSRSIDNSLLSAYADKTDNDTPITVYVGKNYEKGVE